MKLIRNIKLIFFATLSLLFIIQELFAYNALYTKRDSGEPVTWGNAETIQYWLDPGDFGSLTNDQVHTLLQQAMRTWENISSANVPKFEFVGYLPEDIDGTNFEDYVQLHKCYTDELDECEAEGYRNLQTVIIFDEGGVILDEELCRILSCTAYSAPKVFEGNPTDGLNDAVQGIAVFSPGFDPAELVALFTHELGHLLGLGHSPINQQLFYVNLSEEIDDRIYFPTMETNSRYMTATTSTFGATLNPDDIAGISMLYPTTDFIDTTAAISGTIYKADDTPMEHVHVIARDINDPICKAYSVVTARYCYPTIGPLSSTCLEDSGDYIIEGLPPGTYTLEVEDIADEQRLNFTNHYLAGDAEFWNEGDVADEDPYLRTEITVAAGEIVEGVDIVLNRSEVTEDRVKFIPLEQFDIPETTSCIDSTVDYYELIGLENPSNPPPTGGCSLIVPR